MSRFRSIRWRITVTFAILTAVLLVGLSLVFLSLARKNSLEQLRKQLTTDALLLSNDDELRAGLTESRWQPGDSEPARLVRAWSALLDARVTLLLADGTVLADSHVDPLSMGTQGEQPEFRGALLSGTGYSLRMSRALGSRMVYAAAMIAPQADGSGRGGNTGSDGPLAVLRLSTPQANVSAAIAPVGRPVVAALLLALAAGAAIAFLLAEATARPIRRLTRAAARMAQGELGTRIEPGALEEVGQLARVFNRMRDRLEAQVASVTRERERLTSVLDNLVDGVFILDGEGRVQLCNVVAARMVGIARQESHVPAGSAEREEGKGLGEEKETPSQTSTVTPHLSHFNSINVRGQPLAQVVRDHRIVETWQTCSEDGKQAENIFQWDERTLRAIALPFVAGGSDGYIVLLQDMTELHRLERIRRDFVSNISHELRTPLASLRALTETLRDGALDDPAAGPHFLDRIETEVDSLAQMVQELLELSRIESGQVPFRFRTVPVGEIVLTPVERMQPLAARGQIELIVDLPPRLPRVFADAERVHQVITNLVHNALKFSPVGASISISASDDSAGEQVTISVTDTGIGIPAEDKDRIFERFYKTDRARASGGTGLGLAIAKHIVQAHGGHIWVNSIENRGSTFSFTLSVDPESGKP